MSWPVQALLAWVLSPGRPLDVPAVSSGQRAQTPFQEDPPC